MRRLFFTAPLGAIAFVFSVFLVGCGGGGGGGVVTPPAGTITATGRVVDSVGGTPVAGATVQFAGQTVATNAEGRFLINVRLPQPGQQLVVTAPGFYTTRIGVGELTAQQASFDFGQVRLFPETGPPPPPPI